MSFIDSIVDVGSTALKFFSGNPIAGALAKTAITSFALNQISKSINKDNNKDTTGNRIQLDPDTENAIPVVYGDAYVKPIITDAFMTDDNLVMWFCLTLCEQTGNLLSTGAASNITFQRVYWNDFQVNFQSDGVTVASFSDDTGNTTTEPNGLIQIYPFSGSGSYPVNFTLNSSGNTAEANTLMPNWSPDHTMDGLVFALVKITYNKDKNITALGNLTFKLNNNLTLPGDCLYDYMTNTRYGCSIPSEEIFQ